MRGFVRGATCARAVGSSARTGSQRGCCVAPRVARWRARATIVNTEVDHKALRLRSIARRALFAHRRAPATSDERRPACVILALRRRWVAATCAPMCVSQRGLPGGIRIHSFAHVPSTANSSSIRPPREWRVQGAMRRPDGRTTGRSCRFAGRACASHRCVYVRSVRSIERAERRAIALSVPWQSLHPRCGAGMR